MLLPKRVKRRKVQRGRLKGTAHKGNQVTYGDFGLVALEPAWITSRQIEAARIAMTRCIVAVVKPGRVMFEIAGVDEALAREAMRLAANKLPIKCKFATKADQTKEGEQS